MLVGSAVICDESVFIKGTDDVIDVVSVVSEFSSPLEDNRMVDDDSCAPTGVVVAFCEVPLISMLTETEIEPNVVLSEPEKAEVITGTLVPPANVCVGDNEAEDISRPVTVVSDPDVGTLLSDDGVCEPTDIELLANGASAGDGDIEPVGSPADVVDTTEELSDSDNSTGSVWCLPMVVDNSTLVLVVIETDS